MASLSIAFSSIVCSKFCFLLDRALDFCIRILVAFLSISFILIACRGVCFLLVRALDFCTRILMASLSFFFLRLVSFISFVSVTVVTRELIFGVSKNKLQTYPRILNMVMRLPEIVNASMKNKLLDDYKK